MEHEASAGRPGDQDSSICLFGTSDRGLEIDRHHYHSYFVGYYLVIEFMVP